VAGDSGANVRADYSAANIPADTGADHAGAKLAGAESLANT
jgi:hypothetical protein